MMSLLLLAACAAGGEGETTGEDLALAIQKEYAQMTGCTGRFRLAADYETRSFECTVDLTWDSAAGATLTLVEPEIARGVTARLAQGESSLTYDDFSLDTGPLTGEGLTPVEAAPTLLEQIAQGYIAGAELEDGVLLARYRRGDDPPGTGLEAAATFDAESHTLLAGELYWDGKRVVDAQVEDFRSMTTAGQE